MDEFIPQIIHALKCEKDWSVLSKILTQLPSLLTSEGLIHNTSHKIINELTHTLCHMIENANCERLSNTPELMNKAIFQSHIYPILSNLIAYHKLIEQSNQSLLVKNLTAGLPNRRSTCQCITALALCVVEMQDTMIKHLPQVLLSLSKISATVAIAIPFLEFLSYATLHPRLYNNFVSDQYLNIFAIVLPFTNPSKFSDYIVAMAFRVMSTWFLKCRLSYRKVIISYIIRGLSVNVIQPLGESEEIRKRSGSFNSDAAVKSTESRSNANAQSLSSTTSALIHSNEKFHMELVESHMDLLARYTQGLCSTLPEPMPGQDMLLDRSLSSTWLMGQRLITITTSGCRARTFVDGYCERCYWFCKSGSVTDPSNDDVFNPTRNNLSSFKDTYPSNHFNSFYDGSSENDRSINTSRRRHQSAFVPNLSSSSKPTSRAFDDSHLNFNSSPYNSYDDYEESSTCSCWCEGWAEVLIRRASGTTSWKMRIHNRLNIPCHPYNPFDGFTCDLTPIYPSKPSAKLDVDPSVVHGEDVPAPKVPDPQSSPPVFRGTSSSPDPERGLNLGPTPTDQKKVDDQDNTGHDDVVLDDSNSSKISRASSFGRGDSAKSQYFIRSSSFSWKSVLSRHKKQEPPSPSPETAKKEPFFKKDLQLDLKPETLGDGDNKVSNQSLSPLKLSACPASAMPSNPRTPPKTPLKLEDINESKTENFSHVPRGRLATISVMSPAIVKPQATAAVKRSSSNQRITEVSNPRNEGIKPSFIFLQLFYDSSINEGSSKREKPLLLPRNDSINNALKNLDRILPHEMHKIGVIYVDEDQNKDIGAILSNRFGSYRYTKFLRGLGNLIRLRDIDTSKCYIGGLAQDGQDGEFAINWQDNLTQVIFHVSTFMPNKENDPDHKDKIAHIGNDCICIIYNNSGQEIDVNCVRISKFVVAAIVITPLEFESNLLVIQLFDEGLSEVIGQRDPVVLSDNALPSYTRQLSTNLNIASLIYHSKRSVSTGSLYASNCVERLRQIERIKQKTMEHIKSEELRQSQGPYSSFPPNSRSTIPNHDLDESNKTPINCDKYPDDFTTYI